MAEDTLFAPTTLDKSKMKGPPVATRTAVDAIIAKSSVFLPRPTASTTDSFTAAKMPLPLLSSAETSGSTQPIISNAAMTTATSKAASDSASRLDEAIASLMAGKIPTGYKSIKSVGVRSGIQQPTSIATTGTTANDSLLLNFDPLPPQPSRPRGFFPDPAAGDMLSSAAQEQGLLHCTPSQQAFEPGLLIPELPQPQPAVTGGLLVPASSDNAAGVGMPIVTTQTSWLQSLEKNQPSSSLPFGAGSVGGGVPEPMLIDLDGSYNGNDLRWQQRESLLMDFDDDW